MTIREYLEFRDITPRRAAKELNIAHGLIYGWLRGAMPGGRSIRKIIDWSNGKVTASDIVDALPKRRRRA